MDMYLDITVLPDPETSEPALMNNLFAKLHRALVAQGSSDIGVSFPLFGKTLGAQLRLHGSAASLDALMAMPWLKGLRDYCLTGEVLQVPAGAKFRQVKRVQAKSAQNKRKRSIAKGWLTAEDAVKAIPDGQQRKLKYPFAQLNSSSTGQQMRVYVDHLVLQDQPKQGVFNSYGLSQGATVPWF